MPRLSDEELAKARGLLDVCEEPWYDWADDHASQLLLDLLDARAVLRTAEMRAFDAESTFGMLEKELQQALAQVAELRRALQAWAEYVKGDLCIHPRVFFDKARALTDAALASTGAETATLIESARSLIHCASSLRSHVWNDRQLAVLIESAELWLERGKAAGWGGKND